MDATLELPKQVLLFENTKLIQHDFKSPVFSSSLDVRINISGPRKGIINAFFDIDLARLPQSKINYLTGVVTELTNIWAGHTVGQSSFPLMISPPELKTRTLNLQLSSLTHNYETYRLELNSNYLNALFSLHWSQSV